MPEDLILKARRPARRIRGTTARLAEAVREARRRYDHWDSYSEKYTPEYLQSKFDEVHGDFTAELSKIRRDAERQLQRAKDATAPPAPPRDPGAAVLLERQKERAWGRIKPLLEADRDPTEIAARLANSGDRLGVEALIEELPSFLDARRSEGEAADHFDQRLKVYMDAVREHQSLVLTPEEREAREGLSEAERAHSLLQTNLGLIKRDGADTPALYGEDEDGLDTQINLEDD